MRFNLIILFAFTVVVFQNCGEDYNFESIDGGLDSNSSQTSSEGESSEDLDSTLGEDSDLVEPIADRDLDEENDTNDTMAQNENEPEVDDSNSSEPNDEEESVVDPGPIDASPARGGYGPRSQKYLTSIPKALGKLIRVSTTKQLSDAMAGLQPGDVLVLNQGIYRTTLNFPTRPWSGQKPTVIMAAPGSKAIIRASDIVTGWVSQGNGVWTKSNWTVSSQQVFVNGKLLQQIGGEIFGDYPTNPNHPLAGRYQSIYNEKEGIWHGRIDGNQNNLKLNSFHYNKAQKKLYVKVASTTNLNQQQVEASVRVYSLKATKVHGLTLSGVTFEHGNTSSNSQGALVHFLDCNDNVVQDVTFSYADSVALQLRGNYNLVRNNRFHYSGQIGMTGSGIKNRVLNNEFSHSNFRRFNPNFAAGAMKFIGDGGGKIPGSPRGQKQVEVAYNLIVYGYGDGFWCDFCASAGNRIHNNFIAYNEGFGIHSEVSHDSIYYNNIAIGNGKRGIYLPGASRNIVAHNLAAFNTLDGIVSIERKKVDPPKNSLVIGNIMAWNKRGLRMPANPQGHKADYNLYVDKTAPLFSLGYANSNISGLAQWRQKSGMGAQSSSVSRAPSAALQKAINAKDLNVDLSELMHLGEKYHVPAINQTLFKMQAGPSGPL